mgnify:CR=1 FL=1
MKTFWKKMDAPPTVGKIVLLYFKNGVLSTGRMYDNGNFSVPGGLKQAPDKILAWAEIPKVDIEA